MSKRDLKRITAIAIDGRAYDEHRYSRFRDIVNYMNKYIEFKSVKMFLTEDPGIEGIKYYKVQRMGISDYSKFCIHSLYQYTDSDYCLIFQDDGFVINPDLWNDSFYEYDYIGSPWPLYMEWPKEGEQVGNGGFSLRSKKLLELTRSFTDHTTQNEDTFIISGKRKELLKAGLKIAPLEIARLFSVENPLDNEHNLKTCFGFHSKNKLEEAVKIIKEKI